MARDTIFGTMFKTDRLILLKLEGARGVCGSRRRLGDAVLCRLSQLTLLKLACFPNA